MFPTTAEIDALESDIRKLRAKLDTQDKQSSKAKAKPVDFRVEDFWKTAGKATVAQTTAGDFRFEQSNDTKFNAKAFWASASGFSVKKFWGK